MFDIITCRDFHTKLKADFDDFAKEEDSARLALNYGVTAYHLHEWVWAIGLRRTTLFGRNSASATRNLFIAWLERECPGFNTLQDLANGAKHFARQQDFGMQRVAGFGMGPYGIGPLGKSYLLIDRGEAAGDQRWKTARNLLGDVVKFWDDFLSTTQAKESLTLTSVMS
jgi:hypothetical protein